MLDSRSEAFLRAQEIRDELCALSQDIVQDIAGEYIPDIAERKRKFIALHNELRKYEGKLPRGTK